jgi:hypothetical protein
VQDLAFVASKAPTENRNPSKSTTRRPLSATPDRTPTDQRPHVDRTPTARRPLSAATQRGQVDNMPLETRHVDNRPLETRHVDDRPLSAPTQRGQVDNRPLSTATQRGQVDNRPVETRQVDIRPVETRKVNNRTVETRHVDSRPLSAATQRRLPEAEVHHFKYNLTSTKGKYAKTSSANQETHPESSAEVASSSFGSETLRYPHDTEPQKNGNWTSGQPVSRNATSGQPASRNATSGQPTAQGSDPMAKNGGDTVSGAGKQNEYHVVIIFTMIIIITILLSFGGLLDSFYSWKSPCREVL